ncbi:MAG: TolC family protein [Acidobacteria bacterium]|nr:TolC family protein [Acidobacteriota bacterium]
MRAFPALAVFACATAVVAQQPPAQTRPLVPPPLTLPRLPPVAPIVWPPRIGIFSQTQLTLQDVIEGVLANDSDIEVSLLNRRISEYQLLSAQGAYDPVFAVAPTWEEQVIPVASVISGGPGGKLTQNTWTVTPQVSWPTPFYGSSYLVSFASTRLSTNNQFVVLSPQYPSSLTFSFTQPLVRNLRIDNVRRTIQVAKRNVALSDEQFRLQVITSVTQAVQAYWELAYVYGNLAVQRQAVELARQQLVDNQRLVEKGLLAPIDVVQAETQVATFQQTAYAAEQALATQENLVKTLILRDRNSPMWTSALIPVTPLPPEVPQITLDEALADAMTERPELAQLRISSEINRINTRYFRDQTKPQINAIASFSSAGLAGSPILQTSAAEFGSTTSELVARVNQLSAAAGLPPIPTGGGVTVPPTSVGGYGQSLNNLFRWRYPTFIAGLQISFPFLNRTATGNLEASISQQRVIENQQIGTAKAVEADVRNALQTVRSTESRMAAAQGEG